MNAVAALFFGLGILSMLHAILVFAITLGWGWYAMFTVLGLSCFALGGVFWKSK